MITKENYHKFLDKNGKLSGVKIRGLTSSEIPNEYFWVKTIKELIYCYENNITEPIKCENEECNCFVSFNKHYHKFCSTFCSNSNRSVINKKKKTRVKNYGDENYNNVKQREQTCLEKYGETNPAKTEEIKDKIKQVKLEKYGDENYNNIKKQKETILEKYGVTNVMHNSDICDKAFVNSNKYKKYTLPSGKIINIQGYENHLLDELLLEFDESEILADRADMPELWYIKDNKKKRYYPDAYIPSTNTIYEVKSSYTNKVWEENKTKDLKIKSVIENGFNFILKIY